MNTNIKNGFKNQLITIGYMLLFNILSTILFQLSFIGTNEVGKGFEIPFTVTQYKCNLFFVIISWFLLYFAFSLFYTKILKNMIKKQKEIHWGFVLLFLVICIIFCLVQVFLFVMVYILNIGIFSTIINYPNIMYILTVIYIIGYILIDIIYNKVAKKK